MSNVKKERKNDAETGHIKELIDNGYICGRDKGEDYVFISYSSSDWKRVLYEIVYDTCNQYGLRVYFDTKFDEGSDSWLKQFQKNMSSSHCKAILAFISPEYYSSYATLMEMMASQSSYMDNKLVLLIYLGSSDVTSIENTGLGTYRFSDYSINELWGKEMKLFNKLIDNLIENGIFTEANIKGNYPDGMNVDTSKPGAAYWEELDFENLSNNESYWKNRGIETDEDKRKHWNGLGEDKKEKNEAFLIKRHNARLMGILIAQLNKNKIDGVNKDIPKAIHDKLEAEHLSSVMGHVPSSSGKTSFVTSEPDNSVPAERNTEEVSATIPDPSSEEGYTYKIFGKEYHADSREQAKLMYDAFDALMEKYPEKVDELTKRTSVARAETVTKPNTQDAMPPYFRRCKQFTVGNREYLVGTSYGFDAKLKEIKGMFKICEGTASSFELISSQEKTSRSSNEEKETKVDAGTLTEDKKDDFTNEAEGYVYKIFGKEYHADSREQGKLMYDAFEALMEKYPEKADELTKRTSVARAETVTKPNTQDAMPAYFRRCKQFTVGSREYLVGTSYGFDAKLREIEGMFKICEGTASSFELISSQEKTSRSSNAKRGLGELL